MRKDFCAIILSHGRASNVRTLNTMFRYGYTGDYFILVDNEDGTIGEYYENFGENHVVVFNKAFHRESTDTMDNFDNLGVVVYARNECFRIVKELGYRYFVMLDDDYYYFGIRTSEGACRIQNLDEVFTMLVDYLASTNITTISFAQGGDHIGGFNDKVLCKRKAMNLFVCDVERPFKFRGRINEDVNCYVGLGSQGEVFITIMNLQLDQSDTQKNEGGLTEAYLDLGTYVKSFYSVMESPSAVKVKSVGVKHIRMHHSIAWENAVPKIISDRYKRTS